MFVWLSILVVVVIRAESTFERLRRLQHKTKLPEYNFPLFCREQYSTPNTLLHQLQLSRVHFQDKFDF